MVANAFPSRRFDRLKVIHIELIATLIDTIAVLIRDPP